MTCGVLLITHTGVGSALLDVATTLLRQLPLKAEAFEVPFDADLDALLPLASGAMRRVEGDEGVLILTDLYGDHDFSQRDADIARVIPMMQKLLPTALLKTVADGIELGALTHAFDLRMAEALEALAPRRRGLDADLYARAYREVGRPHLRTRQIALIDDVGQGLWAALRMHGVGTLLKVSRLPARAMGFGELQGFLERGFDAFGRLGDAESFLADIRASETRVMRRLFDGDADPFGAGDP